MLHFSNSFGMAEARYLSCAVGMESGHSFRLQVWVFMAWPEGRVLLAVPLLIARWGAAWAWCSGLVLVFCFCYSFEQHLVARTCSLFLSCSLEAHALALASAPVWSGFVAEVMFKQGRNREPKIGKSLNLTVCWTTAHCINPKWCCWAAVGPAGVSWVKSLWCHTSSCWKFLLKIKKAKPVGRALM